MPTINPRVLLRLVVVLLILAAGLFLLHYFQSDRTVHALHKQAELAAETGRLDDAIGYMRRYLELRPNDHDAAVKLGDLILQRGKNAKDLSAVLFLYDRVAREAPDREDVRRSLVDICLRLNRFADAAGHLQPLLAKHPREAQLWEYSARCHLGQNKHDEARRALETAIDCDKTIVSAYALLADVQIRHLHRPEAARTWMEKLVQENPDRAEAYLIRARYFRSLKKIDDCLADLNRVLDLDPKNIDGMLEKAELIRLRGEVGPARMLLQSAIALNERDSRLYRALSRLELGTGNVPSAVDTLDRGIKVLPHDGELLTQLGELLIEQGEITKVESIIKKLESKKNLSLQVQYLNARVKMQQNQLTDALELFESLRTQAAAIPSLGVQVNLFMAHCRQRLGNKEGQIEAINRILVADADHLSARSMMGAIHLSEGRLDPAIKEFTIAARTTGAPLQPKVIALRLRLARATLSEVGTTEWDDLGTAITQLREKHPQSADPIELAADYHLARKQPDLARKLLREECSKKMNDPRLWRMLVRVTYEIEGLHSTIDLLDEARGLMGGEPTDLRLTRAWVTAMDWSPDAIKRLRGFAARSEGFSDGEHARLLTGLADIAAAFGDSDSQAWFLSQLAAQRPRDLPIRLALFSVAARMENAKLLQQVREEIRRLQPEKSEILAVAEAIATMERGSPTGEELRKAREVALAVTRTFPDRADAHYLAALCAAKSGDAREVRRRMDLAMNFDRANPRYARAYLMLVPATEQENLVRRLSIRSADSAGLTQQMQRLAVEVAVTTCDREATELPAWVRTFVDQSTVHALFAARLAQAQGKHAMTEQMYTTLRTTSPQVLDAWIAPCFTANADSAMALTREARKTFNSSRYFLFCAEVGDAIRKHKANWRPEMTREEDHRLFAQASLHALSIRRKSTEATALLRRFAEERAESPGDVAWAQRNLAMMAAISGTAEERRKAFAALRDAKDDDGSTDDLRSRVTGLMLVSRQAFGAERRAALVQAITLQEKVIAGADAGVRDWFTLGQLHQQNGNRGAYRRVLQELMRREPSNLNTQVAFAEDLIAAGELAEAEQFLPRLAAAPGDLRAMSTIARLHTLKNQIPRTLETIERYLQTGESGSADRVRHAAELLDELAHLCFERQLQGYRPLVTAALEKYRFALRTTPESVSKMTGLMAFDKQGDAAIDLLTKMKPQLSTKVLTNAGVTVLTYGTSNPQHLDLVRSWIDAGLKEQPTSVPLLVNLAGLHAIRQQYREAADAYSQILKQEADHVLALNNRAWILAPHKESSEEALKLVERAIGLAGPTGELLDTRARILIAGGHYDRAIEDLQQSLNQGQTSLRYFHLAMALMKQRKQEEAMKTFREAKSRGLNPSSIHPDDMPMYRVFLAQPMP